MSNNIKDMQDMANYAALIEGALTNSISMPEEQPVLQTKKVEKPAPVDDGEEEFTSAEFNAFREEQVRLNFIDNNQAQAVIPVENLPSRGLFYPEGTKIWISSAKHGDIKRWTSMNEDDYNDILEKMQDIIQSCCKITFGPSSRIHARWKDLIDIDRLYILFAIHDYTYPPGTHDVMIKSDEKHNVPLRKDNVKFMDIPEKLMKFYNPDKRCFTFPVRKESAFKDTDGKMDIYVTTIGITDWLMDYVKSCEQRNDAYDKDFLSYASMIIPNWRYLTSVDKYYEYIEKTEDWSSYEWTLISRVKTILANATAEPKLTYIDNGGVEREIPLNFRYGFKSLFGEELDIDI